MKPPIDRLRNHFEHEVARADRHADLEAITEEKTERRDPFGWTIAAAAVVALVVVAGVALVNRSPLESRLATQVPATTQPMVDSLSLGNENPVWSKTGSTDVVVGSSSIGFDSWQSLAVADGVLYGISTKTIPNHPENWTASVVRSEDMGLTWSEIDYPSQSVSRIASAEGVLYAVSTGTEPRETHINVSDDGGNGWVTTDVPVSTDIDGLIRAGIATDPQGGLFTMTTEVTDLVERVIPERFRGEEYLILNGPIHSGGGEPVVAPETTGVTTNVTVDTTAPPSLAQEAEETVARSDGSRRSGVKTTVPAGDVVVLDSDTGEEVHRTSLDDLGLTQPIEYTSRIFHISEKGDITEVADDAAFDSGTPGGHLHDIGDAMMATGWSTNGLIGAVSKDGSNWHPVDLERMDWIVAAGSMGDISVIVGQGQEGPTVLVSDDPTGEWSELDLDSYLPNDLQPQARGAVTENGVVITLLEFQEGDDKESMLAGGTVLSSRDLKTWAVQDISDIGSIDTFGPIYSVGDKVFLTGADVTGNEVVARYIFSSTLE